MSLQDDYFDLSENLKGLQKIQFERIWEYLCELEAQQESLLELRRSARSMFRIIADIGRQENQD